MGTKGSNGVGYVQLRRGILAHCREGKLPALAFAIYVLLILEADPSSGIVWSSAKAIAAVYGYNERATRDALEVLEDRQYLKRFTTPGKHGSYPIAINKFIVSAGARMGMQLNAEKTADWHNPVYESREESVEHGVKGSVKVSSPNRELRIDTRKKIFPPSAALTPPQNGNGKQARDPYEGVIRDLVPFYVETFGRSRYDIDVESELHRRRTRRQVLAEIAKKIAERIVRREQPGLTEPEVLANTLSAMQHVVMVSARDKWRTTEGQGKKFNGLEYIFRDFGRVESALEEAA